MTGFNSIFAVSSIDTAKLYYIEFKRQMTQLPPDKQLRVATIFSYGANEAEDGTGLPDDENSKTPTDWIRVLVTSLNRLSKITTQCSKPITTQVLTVSKTITRMCR